MTETLSASGLSVALGRRRVLADLELAFESGSFHCVLGPNGAGKSTLLRALAGLLPHAGSARIGDAEIAAMSPKLRARRIAWLPQDHAVHWPLPVRDVVALGRMPHGASLDRLHEADRDAVADAMARCDVAAMADRPVTELSGGERARVLLARALATGAEVLLADEPAAGLDPLHQLTIMAVLRAEARRGRVVVAVLHDLSLAARFADTVTLLHGGKVAMQGEPAAVLTAERIRDVFEIEASVEPREGGLRIAALGPAPHR